MVHCLKSTTGNTKQICFRLLLGFGRNAGGMFGAAIFFCWVVSFDVSYGYRKYLFVVVQNFITFGSNSNWVSLTFYQQIVGSFDDDGLSDIIYTQNCKRTCSNWSELVSCFILIFLFYPIEHAIEGLNCLCIFGKALFEVFLVSFLKFSNFSCVCGITISFMVFEI